MTITFVPAILMIGIWIATQIFSVSVSHEQGGGIAYWAHIGGFITGAVLVFLLRNRNTATNPLFAR